jgi:hypothetical protein
LLLIKQKPSLTPLAFQVKNPSHSSRLTRDLAGPINQCDTIRYIKKNSNEGDILVKRYGNFKADDEIIESKKTPKEINQQQQLYNKGLIGISDRTGLDYYAETIEYGRQGG